MALRWMEAFVDRCERQLRGIMSSGSFASEYREFIKVIDADLKGLMTVANMQLRCRGNTTVLHHHLLHLLLRMAECLSRHRVVAR